jgi:hypothetical protein
MWITSVPGQGVPTKSRCAEKEGGPDHGLALLFVVGALTDMCVNH